MIYTPAQWILVWRVLKHEIHLSLMINVTHLQRIIEKSFLKFYSFFSVSNDLVTIHKNLSLTVLLSQVVLVVGVTLTKLPEVRRTCNFLLLCCKLLKA